MLLLCSNHFEPNLFYPIEDMIYLLYEAVLRYFRNYQNIFRKSLKQKGVLNFILNNQWKLRCCRSLSQFSKHDEKRDRQSKNDEIFLNRSVLLGAAVAGVAGYYLLLNKEDQGNVHAASWFSKSCNNNANDKGEWRSDLPTYSKEEVSKHTTRDTRIWVTYRQGVYDVTDYVAKHPGGAAMLLLTAGSNLEPFFRMYGFHEVDFIWTMIEQLRIGNLNKKDQVKMTDFEDPYVAEPTRHPNTRAISTKPYCGGVKLSLLADNFYTPNEYFYVRSHLPVPHVDMNNYHFTLEVEGTDKCKQFTFEDIKRLPKVSITVATMCSGNRRSEMMKVRNQAKGTLWEQNAMSNAKWTGVRLRDLLEIVGITEAETKYKHVQFEGNDHEINGIPYGASIPIWKAVDKYGDVILAYEMNGEPLPLDHGYPLRLIVPGHTGARSVKWLARILVSENESPCHYQQVDYKAFGPSDNPKTVNFKNAPALQEVPVTSAICRPNDGDTVKIENGTINVKGYSYSGGGKKIMRVDVTANGGKTWHTANLDQQDEALPPHHWGWTLWSANLPVEKNQKEVEIWCKAVDSSFNTQPETFENIYNFQGVICNAYHRVKVKLKQ